MTEDEKREWYFDQYQGLTTIQEAQAILANLEFKKKASEVVFPEDFKVPTFNSYPGDNEQVIITNVQNAAFVFIGFPNIKNPGGTRYPLETLRKANPGREDDLFFGMAYAFQQLDNQLFDDDYTRKFNPGFNL
jgi:hypothetical protein